MSIGNGTVKCKISVGEFDPITAYFTEAKTRITSLKASLEANKAELKRLLQSRAEAEAKSIALKRSFNVSLSLNTTFQSIFDSARSVSAPSNSRRTQVEEQLALFRTELQATQASLYELRLSHSGCAEKYSLIAELADQFDWS